MPRLVIFDDSLRGVDLPRQPLIIGRSKRSDIPIHDRLLSRKHCAIIPVPAGFRIVDLKSSYGTYLNGERIERRKLDYDDVIEIGSTVMVYLDTEAWNRGEGLAKLRNPVKAQELVQRLKLQSAAKGGIPIDRIARGAPGRPQRRGVMDMLPVLMDLDETNEQERENLVDLLVDYSIFKTISLWVKSRPDVKRVLTKSVENALLRSEPGNWEDFRSELRQHVREGLLGRVANEDNGGARKNPPQPDGTGGSDGEPPADGVEHDGRSVETPAE